MLLSRKSDASNIEDRLSVAGYVSKLEQQEIERCFARLFSSEDGRKVLAWLQVMTFMRAGNASSSEEQLRHMEGQRSLMAAILRMIDRGKAN